MSTVPEAWAQTIAQEVMRGFRSRTQADLDKLLSAATRIGIAQGLTCAVLFPAYGRRLLLESPEGRAIAHHMLTWLAGSDGFAAALESERGGLPLLQVLTGPDELSRT